MFKQETLKGTLVYDENYATHVLIGAAIGGGVPDGSWEWQQLLDNLLISFAGSEDNAAEGTYLAVEEGDSDGLFIIKMVESAHLDGIVLEYPLGEKLPLSMPDKTIGFLKIVQNKEKVSQYDAVLVIFAEKFIENDSVRNSDEAPSSGTAPVIIASSVNGAGLIPATEMNMKNLVDIADNMFAYSNAAEGL